MFEYKGAKLEGEGSRGIFWNGENLRIESPDRKSVLIGNITQLAKDKKVPLTNGREYFHIQDILGEEVGKREMLGLLARELKMKKISYVFLPTNEKENLKMFMEFFSQKIVFHDDFEPMFINRDYTEKPQKAFDALDWYEKDFAEKVKDGVVSESDYQPMYFYVGADMNSLEQRNN